MSDVHAVRRERLRERLSADGVDGMLVTRLVNVRYLSGFTGSNAALLITPDAAVLATDGRYTTQARAEAPDLELVVDRACAAALTATAAGAGARRLGFEAHAVTVALHDLLAQAAAPGELTAVPAHVEILRSVKDEGELALLREACAITVAALGETLHGALAGRSERSISRELADRIFAHGAEGLAFDTIVAAGPNSAVPHHRPTDRPVGAGELLTIDFGARFGGYHADMTRTVVVARAPAAWQHELHAIVLAAQRAGREGLVPGAGVVAVDSAARSVVEAAGHGDHFPHGLGHGVGLEIHEAPLIPYDAAAILAAGMPVTVEPGVYLPGRGGVRIEDTLVVRDIDAGGAALLTPSTRELLAVG